MEEKEFDKFADEYYNIHSRNIAASGESPDFFAEYKIKDVALHFMRLPLGFIAPCLPTKAPQPPTGGAWLHEIKHDGFRVIAPRWKSGRPKGRPVFYYSPVSVDGNNQKPCEERSNTRCSSQVCGLISGVRQMILSCPGYARFG